eukprot:8542367-Pyramimonas_sp.AAC.1
MVDSSWWGIGVTQKRPSPEVAHGFHDTMRGGGSAFVSNARFLIELMPLRQPTPPTLSFRSRTSALT